MRSNDLAAKLKALSVQVGDIMGEEFASVSFGISDLSIELSSRFRRLSPKGKGGKPKREGRQSNMQAFLKKGGGTSIILSIDLPLNLWKVHIEFRGVPVGSQRESGWFRFGSRGVGVR